MTFLERAAEMRKPGGLFQPGRSIFVARAPGRLDLMGGNVDYTGGMVFQATLREATWAAVQLRDDDSIVLKNPQVRERGWQDTVACPVAALSDENQVRSLVNDTPLVRWSAYALGVFCWLARRKAISGATIYIESDLPMNKGVSSSAALEVAVMKAASAAYGETLSGVELAESCQWAENVVAQSPCGVMDQAAIALGNENLLLPLLCQPCCAYPPVALPELLECRAIDSGVSHAVNGTECEVARAAAFMAYKMICEWEGLSVSEDRSGRVPRWKDPRWNGYLSNLSPSLFRSRFETRLPETLSGSDYLASGREHVDIFTPLRPEVVYPLRGAARYAVEEDERIRLFIALSRSAADETAFQLMGELMYQSNHAYKECGLGSVETEFLVELVRGEGPANGLYGAKMTGAGAGGTVAVLCRKGSGKALNRVIERYAAFSGSAPYVFHGSSPGTDRYGVTAI